MDLITLAEYKSYKSINNPEKDGVLGALISSVSDLIKSYCGRSFIDYYTNPRTEIFTVKEGVSALILKETPIRVISAINSDGLDITGETTIDTELGFVYHDTFFTVGSEIITITYTGGYATTPYDIKLAAYELVDYYANNEHTSRKSFGGSTIEFQPSLNSWPYHIKSILDMYRDV